MADKTDWDDYFEISRDIPRTFWFNSSSLLYILLNKYIAEIMNMPTKDRKRDMCFKAGGSDAEISFSKKIMRY